ncbi:MAG: hypothetical protein D6830_00420, partial [Ignavibacteria bacterium]
MEEGIIKFIYKFNFRDGRKQTFEIDLDEQTLAPTKGFPKNPPEWAKMSYFRCNNCTLDPETHQYCPLAAYLSEVIEFFNDTPSFEKAVIIVENNDRGTYKYTAVQAGVSSLMGIIMAVSGCPVVGKLKPLVRFHLPFASLDETEVRVLSMYILAQYFHFKDGEETDWSMEKLKNLYQEIAKVDRNIVEKLATIEMKDTNRNAVIALSNYADFISIKL